MERKRKKRRQVYLQRRIGALIIFIFFVLLLIFIGKSLLGNSAESTGTDNTVSAEDDAGDYIDEKERNLDMILAKSTVNDINEEIIQKAEGKDEAKELSIFRLKKMRDNAMGRGAKQSLLMKQAYLTFDDGPSSESTEKILDILKEEGVKATFFVIGKNAEKYPEILKRAYNEGHQIAIHTYDHDYKKIYASPDSLQKDIEDCMASLKKILGDDFTTNLYRFPGGSYRKNKELYIDRVEAMGYIYFDWNVLNGDAEGANPSVEYLIKRFNESRKGYNVLLSLMHDTNAKTNTVNSLRQIIKDLKNEGFEFRTLGDL